MFTAEAIANSSFQTMPLSTCSPDTLQLRSMSRQGNILPAGTTLQAKDSFLTKESS